MNTMNTMNSSTNSIVTPEAVALDTDIAELGSRAGAAAIDLAIQFGLLGVFAIAFGAVGVAVDVNYGAVVATAGSLIILWGYYFLLEGLWNGQTIGKRAMRLRVVKSNGQPARAGAILLRNVLRPVDVAFIGPALILFTRRRQRRGGLAAGTIVVHEERVAPPAPVLLQYAQPPDLPPLDTSGLSTQDYGLIRSFLERRYQLDPAARVRLAGQLAALVRTRVQGTGSYGPAWASGPQGPYLVNGDEALLEATLTSVRERYQDPARSPAPPPGAWPAPAAAPGAASPPGAPWPAPSPGAPGTEYPDL
jgi:uncharacterized RDD family membrane protein YckC